jgi:hypothetical protein
MILSPVFTYIKSSYSIFSSTILATALFIDLLANSIALVSAITVIVGLNLLSMYIKLPISIDIIKIKINELKLFLSLFILC